MDKAEIAFRKDLAVAGNHSPCMDKPVLTLLQSLGRRGGSEGEVSVLCGILWHYWGKGS